MFERALIPLVLVAFGACDARYEPDPKFTPASRVVQPRETPAQRLVARLAETRCDHEVLCDQVGPAARYESRQDCVVAFEDEPPAQTEFEQCKQPVAPERVSSCLNAIRMLS